ncbi:hypothetical protein Tco_0755985 [Tanacetum coccineum]
MVGGNGGNQFRQFAGQNVGNLNGYNALQNVRNQVVQNAVQNPGVQNVRNQNGLIVVLGIANPNANRIGNGDVVATRDEGNQMGIMAKKRDAAFLQTEEFDFMATAGDLEDIEEIDQLSFSCGKKWGTVEQNPVTVEETRAYFESFYNNLAIEAEKVNSINRKMKETNADLTTEFVRYKNQEMCFEINQEKYDKIERCYQKSVYQEQCLTKNINALHLSSARNDLVHFLRSKDEVPEEIKTFLKKITLLLQAPVIINDREVIEKLDAKGLDLSYAPSTITSQEPTERKLDLLVEAMYDDYIGGQPSAAISSGYSSTSSSSDSNGIYINSRHHIDTNKFIFLSYIHPNTSLDVDELELEQQHV